MRRAAGDKRLSAIQGGLEASARALMSEGTLHTGTVWRNKKPQSPGASFVDLRGLKYGLLGLRFGAGRRRHCGHFLACRALDAGGLALQIAQVIQPCPANFTFPNHLNRPARA